MGFWKKLKGFFGAGETTESSTDIPAPVMDKIGKDAKVTATSEVTIKNNIKTTKAVKAEAPKLTAAVLNKKTKAELEDLAKSEFGLDINRRHKKDAIVKQILAEQKKA